MTFRPQGSNRVACHNRIVTAKPSVDRAKLIVFFIMVLSGLSRREAITIGGIDMTIRFPTEDPSAR